MEIKELAGKEKGRKEAFPDWSTTGNDMKGRHFLYLL